MVRFLWQAKDLRDIFLTWSDLYGIIKGPFLLFRLTTEDFIVVLGEHDTSKDTESRTLRYLPNI